MFWRWLTHTPGASFSGTYCTNYEQIHVKDGDFSGLGGLEPALSWEGTSKYGDMDLDYGIDVAAQSTSDITTIPRRIWGRARQRVANWDVAARADVDGQSGDSARITIDAGCDDLDLAFKLDGSAGLKGRKDVRLHRVQAVKGLENEDGNRLTVNPRYDLLNREADVVLAWKTGDINIEVTASADTQRIKLSKKIDEDNWVSIKEMYEYVSQHVPRVARRMGTEQNPSILPPVDQLKNVAIGRVLE